MEGAGNHRGECCDKAEPGISGMVFSKRLMIQLFANLKFKAMLRWTLIFLVIAIIAAIFGFGGVAAGATSIAKILFFIFLVLFLISVIFGRGLTKRNI